MVGSGLTERAVTGNVASRCTPGCSLRAGTLKSECFSGKRRWHLPCSIEGNFAWSPLWRTDKSLASSLTQRREALWPPDTSVPSQNLVIGSSGHLVIDWVIWSLMGHSSSSHLHAVSLISSP